MNTTDFYLETWREARTRFTNLLKEITDDDLTKKLANTKNSAGFLIRHIGDVELLFAKNVFGAPDLQVQAKTVIAQRDTGEWTELNSLFQYQQEAATRLEQIIRSQSDNQWADMITTKEFGSKTKAEALGRIISHTAYHAGQLALTLKYGSRAME